ncbi:hypothetical protein FACS189475_03600 [Betaproteobacteria bacterium]|nr:hypothetical protein FACS189475_03600 [Betaproteobacteria bacterium]
MMFPYMDGKIMAEPYAVPGGLGIVLRIRDQVSEVRYQVSKPAGLKCKKARKTGLVDFV